MENVAKAIQLKKELDTLRPLNKEDELRIMQKFRLDWNYHSNHLEGNTLTYGETKALILFHITAQGKSLKDHLEVEGHNEAINLILDIVKQKRPITETFIRELHQLLLKKEYDVDAITPNGKPTKKRIKVGKYKTSPNHVKTKTGEIFRFATPEETPAMMFDLLNWYKNKINSKKINSILVAAEFHYRFIRIHPFDDGNGRLARILMNFILMQFGYPPVIIKTEDKNNYFAVLQIADAGNLEAFVDYIGLNLTHSLDLMIKGAKGESIEEPDDLEKEVALLEQKLNSVGKPFKSFKSKKNILTIYNNSIKRLYEIFMFKNKVFERFYLNSNFELYIDNEYSYDGFKGAHNIINENTKYISLGYDFENLKIQKLESLDFDTLIKIVFTKSTYRIGNSSQQIIEDKYYHEQLTDQEINQIVNFEIKRHKEFIKEMISTILPK